jgi:hypothetical protein
MTFGRCGERYPRVSFGRKAEKPPKVVLKGKILILVGPMTQDSG